MKKLILVSATLLLASNHIFAQKLSSNDRIFFQGLNAGLMSKHEGDVVNPHNGLLILKKVEGTESYRKLLVTQMNTALSAMSFVDRDIKMQPEMLKQLLKISSPKMKTFMSKLKRARSKNRWQSIDAN